MWITKLLIRITQYPSNCNRAPSKISYLAGHHPAPVGSPVDLCPRTFTLHPSCFTRRDTESNEAAATLPRHYFIISLLVFFFLRKVIFSPRQRKLAKHIRAKMTENQGFKNTTHLSHAVTWTRDQIRNQHVAASGKGKQKYCTVIRSVTNLTAELP